MRTSVKVPSILLLFALTASMGAQNRGGQKKSDPAIEVQGQRFVDSLGKAPRLARETVPFPMQAPNPGWAVDIVSSVAMDSKGIVYILQRGDKADPIIALNQQGRVLRSWGKGMYNIPHTIRIDAA